VTVLRTVIGWWISFICTTNDKLSPHRVLQDTDRHLAGILYITCMH